MKLNQNIDYNFQDKVYRQKRLISSRKIGNLTQILSNGHLITNQIQWFMISRGMGEI